MESGGIEIGTPAFRRSALALAAAGFSTFAVLYAVQPLLPDHALAIGVTSYDGGVHYGITADRDAIATST